MARLPNLRIGKPRFMGAHSGKLWLDWPMFGGWLVIFAGRRNAPRLPTAYWSPDGTTYHVRARSVVGFRGVIERERCSRAFDYGYAFREQVERGEVDVV